VKNENPLVSIITTCYNSENTIERTINSVLNQTYKNIEYIIIDADSNDNTKNIIDSYKQNFAYYISEKDQGISDGWNKGIKVCKGEYIQIVNADDYIPPNKIIESIKCFNKHSQASYVFGNLVLVKENEDLLFEIKGDENYSKEIEYWTPKINHPTVMVKKDAYKKYGVFNKNYKIAMDYEWLLRVHKKGGNGSYSEKIITFMQEGGKSDNLISSIIEEYYIAVKYGQPRIKIMNIQIFRFIKTSVRKLIENFLYFGHIKLFRSGIVKINSKKI